MSTPCADHPFLLPAALQGFIGHLHSIFSHSFVLTSECPSGYIIFWFKTLQWLAEVDCGELMFNGYGVSGREDEKVVEMDVDGGG